ncbi:hypothetical protein A2U01_0102509, partial [Trifolium medium]|nr:hypothetical protein [Trifolium medium]
VPCARRSLAGAARRYQRPKRGHQVLSGREAACQGQQGAPEQISSKIKSKCFLSLP